MADRSPFRCRLQSRGMDTGQTSPSDSMYAWSPSRGSIQGKQRIEFKGSSFLQKNAPPGRFCFKTFMVLANMLITVQLDRAYHSESFDMLHDYFLDFVIFDLWPYGVITYIFEKALTHRSRIFIVWPYSETSYQRSTLKVMRSPGHLTDRD